MGLLCMGFVQGIRFADFFDIMHYGYISSSAGVELTNGYTVADVVGGGGFNGMLWTVSIVLCSMSVSYTHLDVYKRQEKEISCP